MIIQRPSWDEMYMTMCYLVASRSRDASTHSGCVIVAPDNTIRAVGYNGFPRGIEDTPERQERPLKYQYFEHAERNALYNAGRNGVPVVGCKLYINWLPCSDCIRGVIQSGIKELIVHRQGQDAFMMSREDTVWTADHDICIDMAEEAGVTFTWYNGRIRGQLGMWSGVQFDLSDNVPFIVM
jgi:dCMP deaminase